MENQSDYIKSLIEYTEKGSYVIDGKINKDRVLGYLETILFRTQELEHFAKIGRATELAFDLDKGTYMVAVEIKGSFKIQSIQELLRWAESEK